MKRRIIKKEIRGVANELLSPSRKYTAATPNVHKDLICGYERQLEGCIFRLIRLSLVLDYAWPHQGRWLDEPEDFAFKVGG